MWRNAAASSMIGQVIILLAVFFFLLLGSLFVLKFYESKNLPSWVLNEEEVTRQLLHWKYALPLLQNMEKAEIQDFVAAASHCHEGYSLGNQAYDFELEDAKTKTLAQVISTMLGLEPSSVRAGFATLTREDFSYGACPAGAIDLPVEGIVISIHLGGAYWLHREIHPHEWHLTDEMQAWITHYLIVFAVIGAAAALFIYRLGKPLRRLAKAAQTFGQSIQVTKLPEHGPHDIRQIIHTFNAMQENVACEVKKRAMAMAAISHDIRSPLTALRVKTELISGDKHRAELIASIQKIENIVGKALNFLSADAASEPKRTVELCSLIESECLDYISTGRDVTYACEAPVKYACRPNGLAQAMRNLIDNALKYAGSCTVSLEQTQSAIVISVADSGPGIADEDKEIALNPFERLSRDRNSDKGGFGLGLAIVEAVCRNHGGTLKLRDQPDGTPGLVATITLPKEADA